MGLHPVSGAARVNDELADNKFLQILYVEDEDQNWEIANLSLRDRFLLQRATNASQAFELLRQHTFDVILMDIQLKGSELDGIAITQILKNRYPKNVPSIAEGVHCPDTPIFFVTAYTARYDPSELRAAGGDQMIAKPVDFEQLGLAIVRASLAQRAEHEQQPSDV